MMNIPNQRLKQKDLKFNNLKYPFWEKLKSERKVSRVEANILEIIGKLKSNDFS